MDTITVLGLCALGQATVVAVLLIVVWRLADKAEWLHERITRLEYPPPEEVVSKPH